MSMNLTERLQKSRRLVPGFLNPVFVKEVRQEFRGGGTIVAIAAFLILIGMQFMQEDDFNENGIVISYAFFLFIQLVIPVHCIVKWVANRSETWAISVTTPLSSMKIITGKLYTLLVFLVPMWVIFSTTQLCRFWPKVRITDISFSALPVLFIFFCMLFVLLFGECFGIIGMILSVFLSFFIFLPLCLGPYFNFFSLQGLLLCGCIYFTVAFKGIIDEKKSSPSIEVNLAGIIFPVIATLICLIDSACCSDTNFKQNCIQSLVVFVFAITFTATIQAILSGKKQILPDAIIRKNTPKNPVSRILYRIFNPGMERTLIQSSFCFLPAIIISHRLNLNCIVPMMILVCAAVWSEVLSLFCKGKLKSLVGREKRLFVFIFFSFVLCIIISVARKLGLKDHGIYFGFLGYTLYLGTFFLILSIFRRWKENSHA